MEDASLSPLEEGDMDLTRLPSLVETESGVDIFAQTGQQPQGYFLSAC
jgi:hypothetical protein